jgi:DNA-directed RNA polymerase specialized sigma24 family protein
VTRRWPKDIVHEAFIKIWNGAAQFDPARGSRAAGCSA